MDENEMKKQDQEISIVNGKKSIDIKIVYLILIIMLVFSMILSVTTGRYSVPMSDMKKVIISILGIQVNLPDTVKSVLFNIRIPRIIIALLVGLSLSVSGATYQGLFKNPMVSPDILGAVSGASFGAAFAMLVGFQNFIVQLSAFIFAIIAVAICYFISIMINRNNNITLVLILAGLVIESLFTAGVSIIKYVADPQGKLPAITFWLMGGLSAATLKQVAVIIIPVFLGIIPLMLLRYKINVFYFGDEEAKAMGVDTKKIRLITITCATLLTATAVSVSGMVGWIGLIIPHISRLLVGSNNKVLLPTSMLIGAIFLLLIDDFARSFFIVEIPLGILTSIIGAPIFLFIMLNMRKK